MIKVSDYVIQRLVESGVEHIFMVAGGCAMYLNDSVGKNKEVQYVCNHHEQASAMAAEGYARVTNNLGVALVTAGPGATNTLTGVLGCWVDSVPVFFLSGQVRKALTVRNSGLPLRQLGHQEADIVSIVKSITKYAVSVDDPNSISYHVSKALYLARSGRPGPVWLDIPLDVQNALVDISSLRQFVPKKKGLDEKAYKWDAAEIIRRIRAAERPVLLVGNGVRASNALEIFSKVVELLHVPVQTAVGAPDLIASDHPFFFGRPGIEGCRASNLIIQNADLLFAIGARMGIQQVTFTYNAFAREAYKIFVDIDSTELKKPLVRPDMEVNCDAGDLLQEMFTQLQGNALPSKNAWLAWCAERRNRFPVVLPEHRQQQDFVHSYYFVEVLSKNLSADDVIVVGNTSSRVSTFRVINLLKGQRLFGNIGCASMGYALPAAIGACFAKGKGRVICITGDGSIQMNIQEFQTIVHHKLPIKIFILNNKGYLAIRRTQERYFSGHYVGCTADSGLTIPDLVGVATAYGFKAIRLADHAGLEKKVQCVLEEPGPVLCDINMSPGQTLYPFLTSQMLPDGRFVSSPPEDMFPFLDRKAFSESMIVDEWHP